MEYKEKEKKEMVVNSLRERSDSFFFLSANLINRALSTAFAE